MAVTQILALNIICVFCVTLSSFVFLVLFYFFMEVIVRLLYL